MPPCTRTLIAALSVAVIGAATVGPNWGVAAQPPDIQQSLIDQGRYLATAGDCISCHTRRDGEPFSGGRALHTPFGVVYTANITPDPGTGIGAWSEPQFERAMREGIA